MQAQLVLVDLKKCFRLALEESSISFRLASGEVRRLFQLALAYDFRLALVGLIRFLRVLEEQQALRSQLVASEALALAQAQVLCYRLPFSAFWGTLLHDWP